MILLWMHVIVVIVKVLLLSAECGSVPWVVHGLLQQWSGTPVLLRMLIVVHHVVVASPGLLVVHVVGTVHIIWASAERR